MNAIKKLKPLLIYTMTSGLGDFIVMGDLMGKVERSIPGAKCLIVHRNNPHIGLWPDTDTTTKFFSVYSPGGFLRLIHTVRRYQKEGYTIFGLQMAPGSLQGFFFFSLLKNLGLINYIVDFNLINADIITPPRGTYILDLHLNQVATLFKTSIPSEFYDLELPLNHPFKTTKDREDKQVIGIHPWSRRGSHKNFIWPMEQWLDLIQSLMLKYNDMEFLIFGRDRGFKKFQNFFGAQGSLDQTRLNFACSSTVYELVDTIDGIDSLITVNTAVVHIGHALQKQMFILNGPSLDIWIPKGISAHIIRDRQALFQASDKWEKDTNFGSIDRIELKDVLDVITAAWTNSDRQSTPGNDIKS